MIAKSHFSSDTGTATFDPGHCTHHVCQLVQGRSKPEAQMEFLDKEAELKLTMMKEVAMAKAERDVMKAFEDKDNCHTVIQDPNLSCQAQSSLNQDAPPFIPKEAFTPFTPQA